jgi:bifunctional non-homologous end joining protein LigD
MERVLLAPLSPHEEATLRRIAVVPMHGARHGARSETFAVVGFSENSRGRLDGLYLARGEDGDLVYAGSVEKGFSAGDVRELEARLRPLITRQSPLAVAVKKPKARWVLPKVLVEVAYPNAGADGRLRHPSFKGFRDDIERP